MQDPTLLSLDFLSPGTAVPSCMHCFTATTLQPCTTSLFTTSPTRWAHGLGGQAGVGVGSPGCRWLTLTLPPHSCS